MYLQNIHLRHTWQNPVICVSPMFDTASPHLSEFLARGQVMLNLAHGPVFPIEFRGQIELVHDRPLWQGVYGPVEFFLTRNHNITHPALVCPFLGGFPQISTKSNIFGIIFTSKMYLHLYIKVYVYRFKLPYE